MFWQQGRSQKGGLRHLWVILFAILRWKIPAFVERYTHHWLSAVFFFFFCSLQTFNQAPKVLHLLLKVIQWYRDDPPPFPSTDVKTISTSHQRAAFLPSMQCGVPWRATAPSENLRGRKTSESWLVWMGAPEKPPQPGGLLPVGTQRKKNWIKRKEQDGMRQHTASQSVVSSNQNWLCFPRQE